MLNAAPKTSQAPECALVGWAVTPGLVPYETALAAMEARVSAIADEQAAECVWLLEHPPLYTAGTSARDNELLDPDRFPVFKAGRGGRHTYHGPGQRIAYVMLDLTARGRDVRAYVNALETWLIDTLARLGVSGERHPECEPGPRTLCGHCTVRPA
jgi:lipoyl(octanoyl) transferase